jgi:hypothetical protein
MNDMQQVALRHHCRLAEETMHPRFLTSNTGEPPLTIVLTVNSGYE